MKRAWWHADTTLGHVETGVGFYKGDQGSYFEEKAIRDKAVLLRPPCKVNILGSSVDEIRVWVQSNGFKNATCVGGRIFEADQLRTRLFVNRGVMFCSPALRAANVSYFY